MWTSMYSDEFVPSQLNNIIDYMKSPDLLFLQLERSNETEMLSRLTTMLSSRSGVNYTFTSITPNQESAFTDTAFPVYLYNPAVIRLQKHNLSSPAATTSQVVLSSDGHPVLKYNPGIVVPSTPSRLSLPVPQMFPLTAAWETLDGKNTFFTVNLVPPLLDFVRDPNPIRMAQAASDFVAQVLGVDETARVIAAGSFYHRYPYSPRNEGARILDSSGLQSLDVVRKIPKVERYTRVEEVGGLAEQVDHMYVSRGVGTGSGGYERVHVNTWRPYEEGNYQTADPIVAKLDICESRGSGGVVLEPVVVDEE
jgi:hypothetical protein